MDPVEEFSSDNSFESESVYDEEDCETDNEEEVKHDMVKCPNCSTKTHYLSGECTNCGYKFKLSKAGYILSGEDGEFICDDEDEIDEDDDDGYATPELDKMSVSSDEDEYTSSEDEDDDDEDVVYDDEVEYVSKKDISDVINAPRRITRSMVSVQHGLKY